jgi:hypothetical protein
VPFYIATGAIVIGIGILATAHGPLRQAEQGGSGVVEDQAEGMAAAGAHGADAVADRGR